MEVNKGIKAYNGLKIKDVYERGDKTTRPKPDWIIMGLGDGASRSHFSHRKPGEVRKRLTRSVGR